MSLLLTFYKKNNVKANLRKKLHIIYHSLISKDFQKPVSMHEVK